MLFEKFEDPGLSHYSYAVGCPGAGAVAVVDPGRNVGPYLEFAARRGLRISHVLETHIHADFASGAFELAHAAGAQLWLSAYDEGETYEVSFEHRPAADGDSIELGSVRIGALHTPGHTPEHLSFLVYDAGRSAEVPMLMLSGDFLFVGSLGRPDLLGEEAKRELAGRLFDSVRGKLVDLPDGLEVHPAHGAGSMCGAGMSGRPQSTLGFERIANPYLDPALDRAAFIERILGSVPPFPPYYSRMKALNARGAAELRDRPQPESLGADAFAEQLERGAVAIDVRGAAAYCEAHVPGSLCVGAGQTFAQWAAWVVPYETPLLLVANDPATAASCTEALSRVGLDDVNGYLGDGLAGWTAGGKPTGRIEQLPAVELGRRLAGNDPIQLLDVRGDGEWSSGHVPQARHVMAGFLRDRLDELPRDARLAVICASGYRSAVAVSVLAAAGFGNVANVTDGMVGWTRAGLPISHDV